MERPLALVMDRDPSVRAALRGALALRDFTVLEAAERADVPRLLRDRAIALLVVEAPADGADLLPLLRQLSGDPRAPVVVAVAQDHAAPLELIRGGCFDVLYRPLEEPAVELAVERAVRECERVAETRRLRNELRTRTGHHAIVGRSAPTEGIRARLRALAETREPVCVSGESGTGKELFARTLHELSAGPGAPFVAVPCAAVSGADWEGYLAQAAGGTLYLEELPELSPALQQRLPATLGLGGGAPAAPDVRVVVSSRRPPAQVVEDGGLTAEAARHLARECVHIPPLRERREDVAPLARHFVATICEINRLPEVRLSAEAVERLERYRWPANVQELRNAMEQAVILSKDGVIHPRELPERVREAADEPAAPARPDAARLPFREAKRQVVDAFEARYLKGLMTSHRGNVTAASKEAGMLRSALQRLLRKHTLRSADFRRKPAPIEPAPDAER